MLFHMKELVLKLTNYMKLRLNEIKAKTINFVFSVLVKVHL